MFGLQSMLSSARSWLSGGDTSGAYEEANKKLEAAKNIKTKDLSELQKEGRVAAGAQAADKAGQAKKAAKAAAMQQSGNRLASAMAGANAAAEAASSGFDEAANLATQQAVDLDKANVENQRDILKSQAANTTAQAESEAQRKAQANQGLLNTISAFSDRNVKDIKRHTYLSKEERTR